MSSKNLKGQKVHVSRPKYQPHLYFYPPSKLEETKQKLLLWSENNQDHLILSNLFKNGDLFHVFGFGETMSGKSNALEVIAEFFKNTHERVIIDASGINFEGCFWAREYKCYCVYPQLLKPKKKATNPNVIEIKLNKKNTWETIIQRAYKNKRVIVLMCEDPLETSYLKALIGLFKTCLKRKLSHIVKVPLLREISFFAYQHGTLKASQSKYATLAKREFLRYIRIGRHMNNQILVDAQRLKDIDGMIGDNIALKVIKRTEGFVENFEKYIAETIKILEKHQVIFKVKGHVCTGTIGLSSFHKTEMDKVEDIGIFPTTVDIARFNKVVENRYIDRVSEYYTNQLNRLIIGRRRHLQDPENSELCVFEIADLLAIECNFNLSQPIYLENSKLVYGEIKFRNSDKHPRIETTDVKKTIQDLAIKKITWNSEKNIYFWTIDQEVAKQLEWTLEKKEIEFPVFIEMISPNGATKGAITLMKKHHIYNRVIKIEEETFYD